MSKEQKENPAIVEIRDRFKHHPPSTDRIARTHERIRESLKNTAIELSLNLPSCRETSLCLTKLEEAMFWANAAVARNHLFYNHKTD